MNQIEKYRLSHTRLPVGQFHGEVGFSLFRSRHGSHQMALMISWCCPAHVIPYAQNTKADHRAAMTSRGKDEEEEENPNSVNVHKRLHLRTPGELWVYPHLANRLLSANPGTHDLFRRATLSRHRIVKRTFFKR